MIRALDHIKNGFSADDAEKLLAVVEPLAKCNGKIVIDFEGIRFFTTLFFNNVQIQTFLK